MVRVGGDSTSLFFYSQPHGPLLYHRPLALCAVLEPWKRFEFCPHSTEGAGHLLVQFTCEPLARSSERAASVCFPTYVKVGEGGIPGLSMLVHTSDPSTLEPEAGDQSSRLAWSA